MTTHALQTEIDAIKAEIQPLQTRLERLSRQMRDQRAAEFVAANHITRADVEMSEGKGKPHFGSISRFVDWMRSSHCSKNWAEWNTVIYRTSDLFNGRMPHDMPATMDDLPR